MTPITLSSFALHFLSILIFLFIPMAVIAPHAVVWEVVLGGLLGLYYSKKQPLVQLPRPITYIIMAIPLWALVTTLWAQYPLAALITSLKALALATFGLYWCRLSLSLSQDARQSFVHALVAGLLIGISLLIVDAWSGQAWQRFWGKSSAQAFSKASLMISLATWPILLWILRRPYPLSGRLGVLACLLFSVCWALFQVDCDTSPIALFTGLCTAFFIFLFPRLTSLGMRFFIPLFIISFPFISLYAFKPEHIPTYNSYIHSSSYLDRLNIWHEVAATIMEQPWQGIGMDGTRYHEKTKIISEWSFTNDKGQLYTQRTGRFSMHPHNAILQLWLELGIVGFALGILLVYQILCNIYHTGLQPLEKAVSAGLFMAVLVVTWVSVGFWENWWISGLWIIVGLTVCMFNMKKGSDESIHA